MSDRKDSNKEIKKEKEKEKEEFEMSETTMRLSKFQMKDIGSIIGPNKSDCENKPFLRGRPSLRKNVLSKAWNSFNLYKEKENLEVENPKLFVQLKSDEEGVFAVIKSDSEQMVKFTKFHLDKYQNEFTPPPKKMVYTLYARMNHSNIPQLIGRGASRIKDIKSGAVENMDDDVDSEQLELCEKSFLKVDSFEVRGGFSDFSEKVRSSERSGFVGWPPEDNEPLVKIFVSSMANKEVFDDFMSLLTDEISEHVSQIMENNSKFESQKETELQECYEALDQEY